MFSPFALQVFLASLALLIAWKWIFKAASKPYPPGPRPLPFIGNLLDIPKTYQWKTFAEWKARWGDIVSFSLVGQRIVVLNSLEPALDLLDQRSAIYSDRQLLSVTSKLLKWDQFMSSAPYGDMFREQRRYTHQYIGSRGQLWKIQPLNGLIEEETQKYLHKIMRQPEEFAEHIRDLIGRIVLRAAYGYHKKDQDDAFYTLMDRVMTTFIKVGHPGTFWVDYIPALQWLPGWLPGMGWKRKVAAWSADVDGMTDVPFEYAKQGAIGGTEAESNLVSEFIGEIQNPWEEHNLKMAAASFLGGGTDTTVSSVHSFFLAMTLYPEVQKRAQQEIDAVVGRDRLPCMSDREQLPYVRALVSEVLRWNPIAPLSLPHCVMEDDIYREYHIPKGAMLFANIWYILRDPEVYTDPLAFKPERYLEENGNVPEQDPRVAVFGFGRRICPGINLAEGMVFMACAMALSAFDVSKAVEDGVEITPEVAYSSGTISFPLPFKCTIKPRSRQTEALVMG